MEERRPRGGWIQPRFGLSSGVGLALSSSGIDIVIFMDWASLQIIMRELFRGAAMRVLHHAAVVEVA